MSTRSKNNVYHAHLFIEVTVPCQKSSKVMCMCVRGINVASFSVIFLLDLETIKLFYSAMSILLYFSFILCLSDIFLLFYVYQIIFISLYLCLIHLPCTCILFLQ